MKLWNYIVLLTGISIFMALAGLNVAGFSALFNAIGLEFVNGVGIGNLESNNPLWNAIFGTTGLLTALGISGAITISGFLYTKDKAFLMIPIITGTFFYWISVLISITNYAQQYPPFGMMLSIIFIALTVGFFVSCIEWFMGQE